MILFPAIDLQKGKAVRLMQGEWHKSKVYNNDPLQAALHWQSLGAKWLHIINLDGAFAEDSANRDIIEKIITAVDIPVQTGGGIRTLKHCEELVEKGAARLIIGTTALENPGLYAQMCREFPGKIGVSLDAKDGVLKSHGWQKETGRYLEDIIPELEDNGTAFIIYTDITRDGMHTGLNLETISRLLSLTTLPVIAAGGVSVFSDIEQAFELSRKGNLQGVVCGKSIYDNTLDFGKAQSWLNSSSGTAI